MDIYVIVEPTLKPGLKAAQVAHAVAGLVHCCNAIDDDLRFNMDNAVFGGRMIVLDGHPESIGLRQDFAHYTFYEPDLDMRSTATAYLVPEEMRDRFRYWPLAYKNKKWWRFW